MEISLMDSSTLVKKISPAPTQYQKL